MDRPRTHMGAALALSCRVAAALVLGIAFLNVVGWATGAEWLTRVNHSWPPMVAWTAVWLAALAVAILLQSGPSWRGWVWTGRAIAVAVGASAVVVPVEHAARWSAGLDQVARPNPQTALAVLLLAVAVGLIRVDRRWIVAVWALCVMGGLVFPLLSVAGYLFDATGLRYLAVSTTVALLLLLAATSVVRPERPPLGWLLARPDRGALVRLYGLAVGFSIGTALLRLVFLALGRSERVAFALSVTLCTVVAAVVGFHLRREEQDLLIEKEQLAQERADAEKRYRILADNAVDIIVHLRGTQIVWASPSVKAALGRPAHELIGEDISGHIHPDDLKTLNIALERIEAGAPVLHRFRVLSVDGDYHWVDGHGKPYTDADGQTDGLIAALRVVDDRVEVERKLEKLARFDTLTGLANRGEAIARLESALEHPPAFGVHVGILFCDVDHFKEINDTWGHVIGDTVLATLAARIRESVRVGDTVGRTGGDEVLVVLPGLRGTEQLRQISEMIRAPVSSVIARADAAMYHAKAGARNTVVLVEPTHSHRPSIAAYAAEPSGPVRQLLPEE